MTTPTLPSITTDLRTARHDLEEVGLALIGQALTPDEVITARHRLADQAAAERAAGVAFLERGDISSGRYETSDGLPNQRVWSLINKGAIFREIAMKEGPLSIVRDSFAQSYGFPREVVKEYGFDDVLISSVGANIACKGGLPMQLHADQGFSPVTPYPIIINVLWMLSDFSAENGATGIAPGTHKVEPSTLYVNSPAWAAVDAPAGTALIFDGRVWHGTGCNHTDQPRYGLFTTYCRPFVRQIENYALTLDPAVAEKCSPQFLSMLGFKVWSVLGNVEGSPHGTLHGLRDRPHGHLESALQNRLNTQRL